MLDILLAVLAVVLTLVLLKKGVNLGLIMLMDCIFIAVAARMSIASAWKAVYSGVVSRNTLGLIAALILIMLVENIMRTTGLIKQMVDHLKGLIRSPRAAAVILPTVLGLLPSPGGARFSCPMVEDVLGSYTDQESKAYVNYWFRHVWMDGFILYPGAILAAELLNAPVLAFFLHMIPFNIIHTFIGFFFISRHIKTPPKDEREKPSGNIGGFLAGFFPVVFIIVVYILLLWPIREYALQLAGILTAVMLIIYKRLGIRQILTSLKESFNYKYIVIIAGVMVFNRFLTDSGLIKQWMEAISAYGIPSGLLFFVLPFIGGFTSGLGLSFVSLSFPMLIPLGLGESLWLAVAAFIAGNVGVMTTPLHLCAVMTGDYFRVKLPRVLKKTVVTEAIMAVLSVVLIMTVSIF